MESRYDRVRLSTRAMQMLCLRTANAQARRQGLSGQDLMPERTGLLIPGAPLVHMVGMRFPLDLVFISRHGVIKRIYRDVRPGLRLRGAWAWQCLELNSGAAKNLGLQRGQLLKVEVVEKGVQD